MYIYQLFIERDVILGKGFFVTRKPLLVKITGELTREIWNAFTILFDQVFGGEKAAFKIISRNGITLEIGRYAIVEYQRDIIFNKRIEMIKVSGEHGSYCQQAIYAKRVKGMHQFFFHGHGFIGLTNYDTKSILM